MAWASRSMFVIFVVGREEAKRKDVKGSGPDPMNAIDSGVGDGFEEGY